MKRCLAILCLSSLVAGCWTFDETPYPRCETTSPRAGSTNETVAVTGFEAAFVRYVAVRGFTTVCVPGCWGRHWCGPGYVETVPTESLVPQPFATDRFRRRAIDQLEKAGYVVGAPSTDWCIDVSFSGPYTSDGDAALEALWMIGTVFFCDYTGTAWRAQLRVRDNRTGRLVLSRDYEQRLETHFFGLLPLFGFSSHAHNTLEYAQNWCLSALTDRALADATAFLGR